MNKLQVVPFSTNNGYLTTNILQTFCLPHFVAHDCRFYKTSVCCRFRQVPCDWLGRSRTPSKNDKIYEGVARALFQLASYHRRYLNKKGRKIRKRIKRNGKEVLQNTGNIQCLWNIFRNRNFPWNHVHYYPTTIDYLQIALQLSNQLHVAIQSLFMSIQRWCLPHSSQNRHNNNNLCAYSQYMSLNIQI